MTALARRSVGVLLVLAVMTGSTGLCESLSAMASAAMACCETVSDCPAHQSHATHVARQHVRADNTRPTCCAIVPDVPAPAAPASSQAVTTVTAEAPVVVAVLSWASTPRALVPVGARPLRPPSTPPYLRNSVLQV